MNKDLRERYIKLGLNIAYYRRLADLSQQQVADAIDISYTHVSKIETASGAASLDIIFKIADVVGVPVHKFFEFRD